MSIKILLLGSSGLLGSTLGNFLVLSQFHVFSHGHRKTSQCQADLRDPIEAKKLLEKIDPDVIINLVGLTNVDECEVRPNQAYLTNVRTVENIVEWIANNKNRCHLIQISTDQVYDGSIEHSEGNIDLTNYYAFSKYAGELAAMRVSSTILRTNFFGRSQCGTRISFTDWIFASIISGTPIQVFDDVLFNPLSMKTLSEVILLVIQQRPIGIFNLGSGGGMSKADFALSFAGEVGLSTVKMKCISINQAQSLKAYRPRDMRMSCIRIEETLGIRLPSLLDEIQMVAKDYREHMRD